jgi:hypothetical protein
MESWVNEIPRSTGSSGSRSRGKGEGKNSDNERRVRARQTPDKFQLLVNAINAVGNNSFGNSRTLRMLLGLCMQTSLVPADPCLEAAAAVEATPTDPILEHVRRWAVLTLGLSKHKKVAEQTRKILADHASSIPNVQALLGKVNLCIVVPTFKHQQQYRVNFAVSADLHDIGCAVLAALAQLGGSTRFLGPPRTRNERIASEALKQLNQ